MKALPILLILLTPAAQAAVTLKDAFEAARTNMETLKRSGAEVRQAIERKNQARGSLLPTITGVGNETRIDRPKARAGATSAFTLTRQYSAALRLQQPLLRGGLFAGLSVRNEEILLAEFQKNANEITLYQLVIQSYFNLLYAQNDQKNIAELLQYSQDRVKELRSFTAVGRSRRAELVQAETQLLTAQTQVRSSELNIAEAQEMFTFYTGLTDYNLAPMGLLPKELPALPSSLEKLSKRPDLMAQEQSVKVAEQTVEVAKGGHYPSVDLVSNYYFDRTGILQTSEWDVAVVVSVPIFQGGTVHSQVKQAVEGKRIAELNNDELKRAARRDLSIQYQNFLAMQSQLTTIREALHKSEEAYKLNLKDYRNGLVTNLEVLQSLNLFIETKRTYDNLITQSHQTYKSIEASTGVLP